MGYRSDVALVVKKNVYEEALKEALINPTEPKYHLLVNTDGKSTVDEIKMDDTYAVLYWEWVKWYDSYECVSFIEDMRYNNDSYFIRIGESYDDIEIELNGDDDGMYSCIDLCRSIDISI